MTRVEKYHRYREEIANMCFETNSSKKTAAKKLDELGTNNVEYDEIMGIHSMYEKDSKKKKKLIINLSKYQVRYCLIAIICNAIILLAVILVGIKLWG